jgi:transcriptional regulator of met regulon
MSNKKKLSTTAALAIFVLLGIAATAPITNFKNLKVLPQNISEHQLDSIMDTYNRALKVNCDFCHSKAQSFTGLPPAADASLDFAADNGMKEEARRMMRLTIDINKKHFSNDSTATKPDYLLNAITCNTCHRGNPYPAHE